MFFKLKKKAVNEPEKRKGPRADFYQSSYFLPLKKEGESATYECWFNNIGEGGLSFETEKETLREGDEIQILYKIGLKLRNDTLKVLSARTSFNKYKYGCAFIDSDENRNLMIGEYFKSNENTSR